MAAIRVDHGQDGGLSRGWLVGVVFLGVGGVALFRAGTNGLIVSLPMFLLGSVLVLPALLRPLAYALGAGTGRLSRGVGHVAVLHLAKERTRSAYTLALVMMVLSLGLATAAARHSFTTALSRQLDATLGFDLELLGSGAACPGFV